MAAKTKLSTDELIATFEGMTVLELKEFLDAFEEKFEVTAAAPLADALLRLIRDPAMRERFGRSAAQRVDEWFSATPMVSKIRDIYDDVLRP